MKKLKIQKRIIYQDDGEGNWLISYADMMTLLFGFFVLLAAFSTPDPKKMEKLKQATAESMGVEYIKPFEELSKNLKQLLSDANLANDVTIQETTDGIEINSKGTLFFKSGSAKLNPKAEQILEKITDLLVTKTKGFRIIVEGHTDDTPIVSNQFPSNWELSSTRAGTVVRLLESKGFPHADLRPVGLSDTDPLVKINSRAPASELHQARAKNRRIVIRIQKKLPKRTSQ